MHSDKQSCSWAAAKHSHSPVFTPLKSQWTGGRINYETNLQSCCSPPSWWVGKDGKSWWTPSQVELCRGKGPGRALQGWRHHLKPHLMLHCSQVRARMIRMQDNNEPADLKSCFPISWWVPIASLGCAEKSSRIRSASCRQVGLLLEFAETSFRGAATGNMGTLQQGQSSWQS